MFLITLIIVHILGILNSMYMWPQCIIDEDGNHEEIPMDRSIEQNLKYIYLWEIGVLENFYFDILHRIKNKG